MLSQLAILVLCVVAIWASPVEKTNSERVPFKHIESRIVNGEPAVLGQFPWQAALIVTGETTSWFCGGSIINETWILTAGHCVVGARFARVLTGSVEWGSDSTLTMALEFVLHEKYDEKTLANDIGLARLEDPLRFDENTRPIILSREGLKSGESVTVSGWGLTGDDEPAISSVLNFVTLRTISNQECEVTYGDDSINQGIICATYEGNDVRSPCGGDSGGPVVLGEGKNAVLVAVVSFVSDNGCESGDPSGYTRSANFVDWIQEHTNPAQ